MPWAAGRHMLLFSRDQPEGSCRGRWEPSGVIHQSGKGCWLNVSGKEYIEPFLD